MLEMDIPQLVAELIEAYERALIGNDIAAVNEFFWLSPHSVRFGTRYPEHTDTRRLLKHECDGDRSISAEP